MKKILIVEDDVTIQAFFKSTFGIDYELVRANDLIEAKLEIAEHIDTLDVIALDGCLHSQTANTYPLIELLVEDGFTGVIVSISSDPKIRQKMIGMGCAYECEKYDLPQLLISHFRENQ